MNLWAQARKAALRREAYKTLLAALEAVQATRGAAVSTDAWVIHERAVMFATVNNERFKLGKPPVSLLAIQHAEAQALGHTDYTTKFARCCADLVAND